VVAQRAGLLAVIATATLCASWGATTRDFTHNELWRFTDDSFEILADALDPRGAFNGHLPLSYWLRLAARSLLGEAPWVWRLHAIIGAVGAAALTWAIPGRRAPWTAWLAGTLVALQPILVYHAHDSENYAWSALTGALTLLGLTRLESATQPKTNAETRGGAALLAAGLLLGALNDFYFGFLALPVALLCASRAVREQSLSPLRPWLPVAVVGGPAALLFSFRFFTSPAGATLDVHADAPAPSALHWVLDVPWRALRRTAGAYLDGYDAGRSGEPWEAIAPAVFGVVAALWVAARGEDRERSAGRVLVLVMALVAALGIAFRLGTGRTFPHEPRSFLTLLPAMAVAAAAATRLLGRAGPIAAILLLIQLGSATWRQLADPADLQETAAAESAALRAARDLVIAAPRIARRFPTVDALPPPEICPAPGPPTADRVIVAMLQPFTSPLPPEYRCTRRSGQEVTLDLSEHHLQRLTLRGAPQADRNAAAFLNPASVAVYARRPPDGPTGPRRITLEPALLSGVTDGVLELRIGERLLYRGPADRPIVPPVSPRDRGWLRARLRPVAPPGLPHWDLLSPWRRDIQGWDALPILPGVDGGEVVLRLAAFGAPWWQVAGRLGRVLMALLVLGGVAASMLRRRSRTRVNQQQRRC